MPEFQNPAAFLLLLFIPLIYVLRKFNIFSRLSLAATFSDWNGKAFSWNKKARNFFSILSKFFLVLGYVFSVVAFAKPVVYKQERVYTSRGTDIVFVLDVSPSMAAKDINGGARIDAAKNCVRQLISDNEGASFALVAMGGESALLVPPTIDHSFFLERLNSLQVGLFGEGTAIGTGLSTAVFHLSGSKAPKKCIVLITDGENNSGAIHPETAAELADKNNITVYTLGIGTSGNVPIEYTDPISGKNYFGYLNSDFDVSSLRRISQAGGGRFFEIKSLNDLMLALSVIIKNQAVIQTYHTKISTYDIFEKLILLAAISFALAWCIRRILLQEVI